jgi:hypothetical protein
LVVGVVVALAGVREARAGQGTSPEDPATAALEEASRAEASDRLPDALKRAYELNGDTELLFRLGELTRKIGQDIPAMRFYRAYLTRDPRGKHRAAADRQVRLLEAAAGDPDAPLPGAARTPPPPKSKVSPTGATVAAPPAASSDPGRANPAAGSRGAGPVSLTLETSPSAGPQITPPVDLRTDGAPASSDEAAPPLPRWLPWVGVVATLAVGTGATLSGLAATHRYDELRSSCGATAAGCSSAQIDDVRSRARTTNLLWAGTGVVAAATGVAIFVNTREAGFSGIWRF